MEEKNINRASAPKAENQGVYHLQLRPGEARFPGYVILLALQNGQLKSQKIGPM